MGISIPSKMKFATGLILLAFLCGATSVLSSTEDPTVYPLGEDKDSSPVTLAESVDKSDGQTEANTQPAKAPEDPRSKGDAEPDESYGGVYHAYPSQDNDRMGSMAYDEAHNIKMHRSAPDGMP